VKRIKFNASVIPFIAAIAQGLQVGHAGYVYLGVFGAMLGGVLGLAITVSTATAASRIGEVSRKRRWLAIPALIVLLLLSPAAVAPAAYQTFAIGVPWLLVMASVVWAVAPDACMVLSGAIAGKSLVATEQPVTQPQSEMTAKPKRSKAKTKSAICPHCENTFSQNGLNAHVAYCKANPERRSKFSIAVSAPVEVTK
jgi:hypothetical protein